MAVLYIGSTAGNLSAMPDPKHHGLTVRLQDVDAGTTGRTANGTMIRNRVAGGASAKRKLEIEWPMLNGTDAATVLQAVAGVFVYVRYPDPYTNANRTAQFYVGDREAPVYSVDSNGNPMWDGIKYNLIEK